MTIAQLSPDPPDRVPESDAGRGVPPRKRSADARGSWMVDYGARRILGMRVDATTYAETTDAVTDMATAGDGGMVCVATVHMIMESFDDPEFRRIVNSADRVTPDGMPLVWGLRVLGVRRVEAAPETSLDSVRDHRGSP